MSDFSLVSSLLRTVTSQSLLRSSASSIATSSVLLLLSRLIIEIFFLRSFIFLILSGPFLPLPELRLLRDPDVLLYHKMPLLSADTVLIVSNKHKLSGMTHRRHPASLFSQFFSNDRLSRYHYFVFIFLVEDHFPTYFTPLAYLIARTFT